MTKYIIGGILIIAGAIMIVKTDWMLRMFGRVAWAEAKLGVEGGTRIFYKLLGIVAIILAFMLMSGYVYTLLERIFGNRI